ncbi:hypothetical protein BFP97_08455 [Roseivirga sp. 4D4]|uniref:hypothetical protein n=1 Tax=Roseivirga sp. 4D4 TaxID=1889784 RepID=UPI0008536A5D|nr:hypothetical protein [Roseivirga sp. 4D4]OEK01550.1 hypothetical protein BFP97_08455 [Roseivirga sp. 4D4]
MSTPNTKPRVIKDFEKLDLAIQEQIKLEYPEGFEDNLISFTNQEGKRVSALPFETDEKYYLVRMTIEEAQQIIEDDDDYDDDGNLKDDIKEEYQDKHEEEDEEHDPYADDNNEED